MTFRIYGKIKFMFQTTNQIFIYIYIHTCCVHMECILYTCASWNSKYSVPQVTPLSNYFFVAYFWNWPGENKGWLSQTEQHGNMSKIFHLEKTWEKSRVNFAREGGLVDVPINQSINQWINQSINKSINQLSQSIPQGIPKEHCHFGLLPHTTKRTLP